jgi:hypothetical protein
MNTPSRGRRHTTTATSSGRAPAFISGPRLHHATETSLDLKASQTPTGMPAPCTWDFVTAQRSRRAPLSAGKRAGLCVAAVYTRANTRVMLCPSPLPRSQGEGQEAGPTAYFIGEKAAGIKILFCWLTKNSRVLGGQLGSFCDSARTRARSSRSL